MTEYIDEMLHLTADIAEELLALKDTGRDVDANLCNRINRLAQLASDNMHNSPECPTPQDDNEAETSTACALQPVNNEEDIADDSSIENAVMAEAETEVPQFEGTETACTPQPYATSPSESHDAPQGAFSSEQIRNAFSINDIFLFQRTLFKGSSHRMAETLEAAANCASMDELRDYLSNQQHINLKSDEAIDFMGIIAPFLPR